MMLYISHSTEETRNIGRTFAVELRPGSVVALKGTLGSGKTQFVKGACEGLGVRARVSSPTFTFINEYPAVFGTVVHIDLYRIENPEAVYQLGIEEYFNDRTICFIEWPEVFESRLPAEHVLVELSHGESDEIRRIQVNSISQVGA